MSTKITETLFKGIPDLLDAINEFNPDDSLDFEDRLLFRGQNEDEPLLPSIARKNARANTIDDEKKMLKELQRRAPLIVKENLLDNWDWLAYAQHNGMATRFLDWSLSPLTALWFAVENLSLLKQDSYLYAFAVYSEDILTDAEIDRGPFAVRRTKIFKPRLNNHRLVAQNGWFTCHYYSQKRFVSLERNKNYSDSRLLKFKILAKDKLPTLKQLDLMGVNYQSIYPETFGLAKQLNWEYRKTVLKGF